MKGRSLEERPQDEVISSLPPKYFLLVVTRFADMISRCVTNAISPAVETDATDFFVSPDRHS